MYGPCRCQPLCISLGRVEKPTCSEIFCRFFSPDWWVSPGGCNLFGGTRYLYSYPPYWTPAWWWVGTSPCTTWVWVTGAFKGKKMLCVFSGRSALIGLLNKERMKVSGSHYQHTSYIDQITWTLDRMRLGIVQLGSSVYTGYTSTSPYFFPQTCFVGRMSALEHCLKVLVFSDIWIPAVLPVLRYVST